MKKTKKSSAPKLVIVREQVRMLQAISLAEVVGGRRPADTCDMGGTCKPGCI